MIPTPPPTSTGRTATIALGTTVAMWAALYVVMMPGAPAPQWLAPIVMVLAIFGGGWVAGRVGGTDARGGAAVGAAVGAINLLILGALLGGDHPGEIVLTAAWWIAAFMGGAVALGALGVTVFSARTGHPAGSSLSRAPRRIRSAAAPGGTRMSASAPSSVSAPTPVPASVSMPVLAPWTGFLAAVTAVTTFLLLVAGGIVTAREAGLAVPGWLTAFDYPLVLLPLHMMLRDGDVFAEHTHRLWGLLVGLAFILLTVQVWRTEPRRWVRRLVPGLLLAVIVQGTAGGLRVTEASIALAIIHGAFGQMIFAAIVAVAVVTARSWRDRSPVAVPARGRAADVLVALLLVQLVLGALYRHLNRWPEAPTGLMHGALGGHILMALLIAAFAVYAAGRAAAREQNPPPMRRWGAAILIIVGMQILLGVGAVTLVLLRRGEGQNPTAEVIVTTAHQATGALLLASATALAVWGARSSSI